MAKLCYFGGFRKATSVGQESEKSLFEVFVSTFLCIPETLLDVFS